MQHLRRHPHDIQLQPCKMSLLRPFTAELGISYEAPRMHHASLQKHGDYVSELVVLFGSVRIPL